MADDFAQFRRDLDKMSASIRRDIAFFNTRAKNALGKFALDVEATAKTLCPVDTGNLRSSIGHEHVLHGDDLGVEIGPHANYGPYVELGTGQFVGPLGRGASRQAPRPYMAPAFDKHVPAFEKAVAQLAEPFRDL